MTLTRISNISLFGLGKLGACVAAAMAAKGFNVTGVDTDPLKVKAINEKRSPVFEPDLGPTIAKCGDRLRATSNEQEAVLSTEASLVVVPTPSEPDGRFSLDYILDASQKIGAALRQKSNWHLVAIISTVMPGDTESRVIPLLEDLSGRRCGSDLGVCYSPEFISLGSVLRDFLNPDFVLIGESDNRAGDVLASIYRSTCENSPPIQRMNLVNAELSKLAVNTYLTTKISFANTVAAVCERLDGADVDVVTEAMGLDSRIGQRYLTGGAPYGGPCFPRDVRALSSLSKSLDVPPLLAEATAAFNRSHAEHLLQLCLKHSADDGVVGILGLAYKPLTNVVEESAGMFLASELAARGRTVAVHDPAAMGIAQRALHENTDRIVFCEDSESCIQRSDVVVVTTPSTEYTEIDPTQFARNGSARVVIDCWRMYRGRLPLEGVTYVPVGVGLADHHAEGES